MDTKKSTKGAANSASPQVNTRLILSYNISFQAMTHYSRGTAGPLGQKCTPIGNSKVTICAKNMADMIEGIPAAMQVPSFDFIGLQEASRWLFLRDIASTTLKQMEAVGSKEGRSEMVSFYDGNRYKLKNYHFGDLSTDRPYQILIFENLFDNSGTIFINVHNAHRFSFTDVQHQLGAAIKSMYISSIDKQYRIIAVGDFNEAGWDWGTGSMYQKSWTPFIDDNISTSISIAKPVFSCCKSDGNWSNGSGGIAKGSRGGDYIFDSKNAANILVPPNYDPTSLQSDHLPVAALLS